MTDQSWCGTTSKYLHSLMQPKMKGLCIASPFGYPLTLYSAKTCPQNTAAGLQARAQRYARRWVLPTWGLNSGPEPCSGWIRVGMLL